MGICQSGCKSFIGYYLEPAKLKVKDTVLQRLSSFQMPVANLGVPRVTFTSDQLAANVGSLWTPSCLIIPWNNVQNLGEPYACEDRRCSL